MWIAMHWVSSIDTYHCDEISVHCELLHPYCSWLEDKEMKMCDKCIVGEISKVLLIAICMILEN